MSYQKRNNSHINNKNYWNEMESKNLFGFWIYLMSDCILFACLFAIYSVFLNENSGGPYCKEIFDLKFIFLETLFLLFSSISYSIVILKIKNNIQNINIWLLITLVFGIIFVDMEIYEFHHLIKTGFDQDYSAFLSSFFVLVGTHCIHVLIGIIWIIIMMMKIYKKGININKKINIICLSFFWHFIDIIWICMFTMVYLLGFI